MYLNINMNINVLYTIGIITLIMLIIALKSKDDSYGMDFIEGGFLLIVLVCGLVFSNVYYNKAEGIIRKNISKEYSFSNEEYKKSLDELKNPQNIEKLESKINNDIEKTRESIDFLLKPRKIEMDILDITQVKKSIEFKIKISNDGLYKVKTLKYNVKK